MFGAGEPRLRALEPEAAARLVELRAAVDPHVLRAKLDMLPAPRVRQHLPEAMAATDGVILDAFRSAEWQTGTRKFEVRSPWGWAGAVEPRAAPVASLAGVNVVAVKEGAVPEALVVVAHHDTVPGSAGADDNGSGVVALMELARLLGPVPLHRTVVLAAVDHEELGFHGSRQLVRELSHERPVLGAWVFEMLGYTSAVPGSQRLPAGVDAVYRNQVRAIRHGGMRGTFLAAIYLQAARHLATGVGEGLDHLVGPRSAILVRAPADLPLIGSLVRRMVPCAGDFVRSDHVSFWRAGIPAVQLTDTADFRNPHYHGPSDTPETLNYPWLADVIAASAFAVERLARPAR